MELRAPAISDTHPGLLEAVGPPALVRVVRNARNALGLLELLPQPLYPVVVARSQSAAADREKMMDEEGPADPIPPAQEGVLLGPVNNPDTWGLEHMSQTNAHPIIYS